MMYLDTLKKREPEFVWELKQAALRCRLINEQRKKNGLPAMGKHAHRDLRPISTAAMSSSFNEHMETENQRRMYPLLFF